MSEANKKHLRHGATFFLLVFAVAGVGLYIARGGRTQTATIETATAEQACGSADQAYVVKNADGSCTVRPFDWSTLAGQTYDWYDLAALNAWIKDGGARPSRSSRSVVNPDGTPNLPSAPAVAPNLLTVGYEIEGQFFLFASQPYAFADLGFLSVRLDPGSPTFQDEVNYVVNASGLSGTDEELFRGYLESFDRRQQVMTELKTIVRDTFSRDTENMTAALDAVNTDPALDTVVLTPGTFYAARTVLVERYDGTLKGSGREATLLETVPGGFLRHCDPLVDAGGPRCGATGRDPYSWSAAILLFAEGDVHVSDMTMRAKGSGNWRSDGGFMEGLFRGIDITGRSTGTQERELSLVSSTIERVDFQVDERVAELDRFTNNVHEHLGISGEPALTRDRFDGSFETDLPKPIKGDHHLAGNIFERTVHGFLDANGLVDSTLRIGGSEAEKNVISDPDLNSARFMDISNSIVEFSHNEMRDASGLFVVQGARRLWYGVESADLPEPSTYLFTNNVMHRPPRSDWGGFELWNVAGLLGKQSLKAFILDNTISVDGQVAPWGPIFGYAIDDVVVANNTFTGNGSAAIYASPFSLFEPEESKNWVVHNNELSDFTPSSQNFAVFDLASLPPSHIHLGSGTSGFTVIGNGKQDRVLNLGTGNAISNATVIRPGPPSDADIQLLKEEAKKRKKY